MIWQRATPTTKQLNILSSLGIFLIIALFLTFSPKTKAQGGPMLGFHLAQGNVEHIEAAKAAGAGFVVLVFNWDTIEPDPNNVYWEVPDAALRTAEFYGLEVVARLDQPPQWAFDDTNPTPWQLLSYEVFVRRVVSRYGDRLSGIIIWNEPNLSLEWNGRPPVPEGYVQMLKPAYRTIKSVAPNMPVIAAGMALTPQSDETAMSDLEFLQGIYDFGGGGYFDILAAHPYGFGQSPTAAPHANRLNFRRLELQREVMVANGDAHKPVWVTEMGWRTSAPNIDDTWQVIPPPQQSDYTIQAINYAAQNYPWLEKIALWQLNAQGDDYGYNFWDGPEQASPAYQTLVTACEVARGSCQVKSEKQKLHLDTISILEPDVTIRLGDQGTLHPHWVHLHRGGQNLSPAWQGDFFLSTSQAQGNYSLVLQTMQVDQLTNLIQINGFDLAHLQTRPRPNPTSTWVTQRFEINKAHLQPGHNTIKIKAGQYNPAHQYSIWRWENFQFRDMRLVLAQPLPNPTLNTWQPLPTPGGRSNVENLPLAFSDFLIDPTTQTRWFVATTAGIYRSQDSGQTWQTVSPPWPVWDIAFGPAGRLFIGRSNGVAWADNLSHPTISWQETKGLNDVLFFNVDPHPADSRVLLGGTWGNGLGLSYDSGNTMRSVYNGLEALSVLDILWHPNEGQLTSGTIQGLYRTDNFGEGWFKLPGPLKRQTVYSLLQTEDTVIWAGASNGLWFSQDYGVTWQLVNTIPKATVIRLGQVALPDRVWLWAGTELSGLWLSKDQGQSWHFAGLAKQSIYNLQVDPLQPSRLIAVTNQGLFDILVP